MDTPVTMQDLADIKKNILELHTDIKSILDIVKTNSNTCNKMSSHIDFIETTYDNIKRPLNYLKFQVEKMIGSSEEQKTIEHEQKDIQQKDIDNSFVLYDSSEEKVLDQLDYVLNDQEIKNKFINSYGDCIRSQPLQ